MNAWDDYSHSGFYSAQKITLGKFIFDTFELKEVSWVNRNISRSTYVWISGEAAFQNNAKNPFCLEAWTFRAVKELFSSSQDGECLWARSAQFSVGRRSKSNTSSTSSSPRTSPPTCHSAHVLRSSPMERKWSLRTWFAIPPPRTSSLNTKQCVPSRSSCHSATPLSSTFCTNVPPRPESASRAWTAHRPMERLLSMNWRSCVILWWWRVSGSLLTKF